jgi:ABC-type transport system involved in multi-copper enzyme maturation permease subunit
MNKIKYILSHILFSISLISMGIIIGLIISNKTEWILIPLIIVMVTVIIFGELTILKKGNEKVTTQSRKDSGGKW